MSLDFIKSLTIEGLEGLIEHHKKKIMEYQTELKKRGVKYRCLFIISDKLAKYYLTDEAEKHHITLMDDYTFADGYDVSSKKVKTNPTLSRSGWYARFFYLKEIIDGIYIYR